jgi:hypothetical protein
MNNTYTPPAEGKKWTQEHEREWYEKVVANSTLDNTEIETDLPFTSPEIQARIASAVQISFWEYAKDIRITNRFYLDLSHFIETYTKWKHAPEEKKAKTLEDLTSERISMKDYIVENGRGMFTALEKIHGEEKAPDIWNPILDAFLRELIQKVVEPVFQKTLK